MNVLCSKGTAYTVDLAYGGKYGQGSAGNVTSILTLSTPMDGWIMIF